MRSTLSLLLLLCSATLFAQKGKTDCASLKHGTFKYVNAPDTSAYVVINGNEHAEYYNNGQYHIKSRLEWKNNCEWVMTMIESTVPNFPYKPGDRMTVSVQRIEKDMIYFRATVKKDSWDGQLRRVE